MRHTRLVWGLVLSGSLLAGCVVQPSGRYQSDPNHYPYYRAVEEPPSTPEEGWLKGPRYMSGWIIRFIARGTVLTPKPTSLIT